MHVFDKKTEFPFFVFPYFPVLPLQGPLSCHFELLFCFCAQNTSSRFFGLLSECLCCGDRKPKITLCVLTVKETILFSDCSSTLQMLTNIENRLENLFVQMELLPQDKLEAAEKVTLLTFYELLFGAVRFRPLREGTGFLPRSNSIGREPGSLTRYPI